MDVYYGANFWGHPKEAELLQKIELNQDFTWDDITGFIPAIYVGEQGIAIDFCVRIENEAVHAFLEKWKSRLGGHLSHEEQEKLMQENPLTMDFSVELSVNGEKLENDFGCGASYSWAMIEEAKRIGKASAKRIPEESQAKSARRTAEESQVKSSRSMQEETLEEQLMREYSCDENASWCFKRHMCKWDKKPAEIKSMAVTFIASYKAYPCDGIEIGVGDKGNRYELISPVSGASYELQILDIEEKELNPDIFKGLNHRNETLEYPCRYLMLSYEITPQLPEQNFRLQDTRQGDAPQNIGNPTSEQHASGAVSVICGADGPTSVFIAGRTRGKKRRSAMSALHFEPIGSTVWEPIFMEKEREDMVLHIENLISNM